MPEIKIVYLEAALLPNGELLHFGQSLGYVDKQQLKLVENGAAKLTRGQEMIVAIKPNIA